MSQGEHLAGAAGASLAPLSYVRRGLLLYINDDDGDVIVAAGLQGGGEQAARRPLGVVWGVSQNLRDPCLRDHVREPVRTEQDAVAGLYGQCGGVDVDLLVRPEGAGDEVLLGMLGCLIPGQVAATHKLRDERVVLRYGVHVAAAHKIGPRITDVCHLGHGLPLRPSEPYGDHGGTHPRELLVAAASGHYPAVRLSNGRFEGFVRLQILEHFYGEGARDLPGLEAPYAVGDDEEGLVLAVADEQGVLVVLAHLAGVGNTERLQLQERQSLLLVPEGGRADPDGVPVPQGRGAHGLVAVHESAVGRAEILHVEQSPVSGELGVVARGVVVALQDDGADGRAPDAGLTILELEARLGGEDLRVLDYQLWNPRVPADVRPAPVPALAGHVGLIVRYLPQVTDAPAHHGVDKGEEQQQQQRLRREQRHLELEHRLTSPARLLARRVYAADETGCALAESQLVAAFDHLTVDGGAVEQGAVRGAQILDDESVVGAGDPGVLSRHVGVVYDDVVLLRASYTPRAASLQRVLIISENELDDLPRQTVTPGLVGGDRRGTLIHLPAGRLLGAEDAGLARGVLGGVLLAGTVPAR